MTQLALIKSQHTRYPQSSQARDIYLCPWKSHPTSLQLKLYKKDVIGQEAEEYKASHGSEVAQLWEHLASMIGPWFHPQHLHKIGSTRTCLYLSSQMWGRRFGYKGLFYWEKVKNCSAKSSREPLLKTVMEVLWLEKHLAILKAVTESSVWLYRALTGSISFPACESTPRRTYSLGRSSL